MAAVSSSVSLAWDWVLEALASCKQVDASLLNDLITRAPDFSDNLGKSTREVIALRCLEGLFGLNNGTTNDVPSRPDLKIEFNSSESCEDVLQRIVREMPISNLRMAGSELLKWDVCPFIMHKRACLPKCALEQLKDTLLEGTHPSASFLRERSGLAIRNECDDRNPVGEGDPSALSQRFDGNDTDHQMATSEKFTALTCENGNGLLQEDLPHRIVLPSKRYRSDLANEKLAGQCCDPRLENDGDLHFNAKKSNQGSSSTIQSVIQDLVPLHRNERLEDSSGRTILDTKREGCDLAKESQVSEDVHDEYVPQERIEQSSDVNDDDVRHNQLQSCNNDKFPQDISVDGTKGDIDCCVEPQTSNGATLNGTQQRISIDATKDNHENNFQLNTPLGTFPDGSNPKTIGNEAEDNMEHYCEEEMLSDSDGCHDEKIDVATKKHSFLSSQSTCGQDSMSAADWTEQNLCMKCNKDGQLLVCSASDCPLVVHENCLGSSASFDNKGNFYCPFCAYSLAISEYLEAKRKASLAKKGLAAFIGMENKYQREKHSKRLLHKSEQNESRENGDANLLVKSYGNGNLREEDKQADHGGENINREKEEEDRRADHNGDGKQQAEPSVPYVSDNLSCREEDATPISWALSDLSEEKQGRRKMVQGHQSIRGLERQQNEVPAVGDCDDNNSCFRDTETSPVSWRQCKVGIQQEDLPQQVTNPHQEPACEPNIKAEDTAEDEDEKSTVSKYFIRFRSQEKRYNFPAIHLSRRKKISWTAEEEEILKEGVRRFSRDGDRNIPWKKIWEFGGAVFEKGRTPIDLKDKWRNICKGTPKPK